MRQKYFILTSLFFCLNQLNSQTLLIPDRVFDGKEIHADWVVAVDSNRITYAGPLERLKKAGAYITIKLEGKTVMPGLIEGHSHLLLHPYNETDWNDQVLKESPVERAIRGVVHAEKTLLAGVTAMRDLGSEGAGYTDIYLKKSIDEGLVPGPRTLMAGPAIVATGAYGPKGFHDGVQVPLGAVPVTGKDRAMEEVRTQLGNGANLIKIYADYRWGKDEPSQPTFLQEEIDAMVATANTAGRYVVAHASTPEGMRRAIMGGVETIEHGDGGTTEIFELMKTKGIALCPTLAAGDAIEQYKGWQKGKEPDPERIAKKKKSFALALESGVEIVFGGDVGVFTHGENYRELELMVDYGMKPLQALQSATSVNARILHFQELGMIQEGYLADIIAVEGNPVQDISRMRRVKFVMKDGSIYKNE
ncbi:MAG: amidohydrolase family protein [Muricauda sp.]|jgi:imidazolonepropionase-like amidohydrolase|nr:amidohydrolase family protein [Allomuricauda sp.]MBO6588955.1 amidohydrolase family protein [Allomuricauda sp.]MBO6618580.1 amidohydrolase family protein [Allomuricauda sp.]MBO6644493.1 amidohydrolase family protein [Allomuricauda sp.]MBO6746393.1 amidohydrolase family protein [Allomuricauda sp.]MBO6843522.1 amidohydrolase family protein [Allomuricauda sp.]